MKNIYRILSALISVALVFCLCACATTTSENPGSIGTAASDGSGNAAGESFAFIYKDVEIKLGEDADPVIEKLGEPVQYFEAESCAFEGLDKTYTYPEFVLDTYPEGNTDCILAIRLTTDTVSTPEGICLGDTFAKVTSVYGEGYTQDVNSYVYTKGRVKLTFIIAGDTVSSISYSVA